MNTHDLANALSTLAKVLRAGPNMDITDLKSVQSKTPRSSAEIAVNLSTLIELSKIDKARWAELISEYNFPIEIRPRDASRDVLGKLFNYLDENPSAQERLKISATRGSGTGSPELMRALGTLLKGTAHEPPQSGNQS